MTLDCSEGIVRRTSKATCFTLHIEIQLYNIPTFEDFLIRFQETTGALQSQLVFFLHGVAVSKRSTT